MKFKFLNSIAILIGLSVSISVFGQDYKIQKANTSFENMSYPDAVRTYEKILSDKKLDKRQEKEILTNLGMTYKKLQDFRNAKRIYAELFKKYEKQLDAKEYLNYAQVLAGNGNYREAQKMYSQYGEYQKNDLRGGRFALAYMDDSHFYKDSAQYEIQYMDQMNSRFADFSPTYYENGLVFVSARKKGTAIKRVFGLDETPFLDLYLYPDSTLTFIPTEESDDFYPTDPDLNVLDPIMEYETTQAVRGLPDIQVEEFSKKLNSKYHEGPLTFSKDFKTVIFTRNNYLNGRVRKSDDGFNMLKLYMAEKNGDKWTNITELPFNSNNYSTGHPAFSPENQRLYFVSDMPGGYGGTDIYYVDFINGEWGSPINLGPEINTEGNEMFPFIDQYGNMYFASDGLPGLGGLDIFYIELRNGIPQSEAENLGAPINSSKDDFGLITDGNRLSGFFSSNRKRGYSDDNIYSFVRGCNELNLLVFERETLQPITNAEVRVVRNGVNRDAYYTDENGGVSVCLEANRDFYFKVFKDGFDASTITYGTLSRSLTNSRTISVFMNHEVIPLIKGRIVTEFDHLAVAGAQVTLENTDDGSTETVITGQDGRYTFQPLTKGNYVVKAVKENSMAVTKSAITEDNEEIALVSTDDYIVLENINYDYGKYDLKADGRKELEEKVIPILEKYPDVRIELSSHTDSRSSQEFNLALSQKRADKVKQYLVNKGIDEDRIVALGYGKSKLLNDCTENKRCTAAQHRVNRRTEIKILNISELALK